MKKYIKPTAEIFETEVTNSILNGSPGYGEEPGTGQMSKDWQFFEDEEEDW